MKMFTQVQGYGMILRISVTPDIESSTVDLPDLVSQQIGKLMTAKLSHLINVPKRCGLCNSMIFKNISDINMTTTAMFSYFTSEVCSFELLRYKFNKFSRTVKTMTLQKDGETLVYLLNVMYGDENPNDLMYIDHMRLIDIKDNLICGNPAHFKQEYMCPTFSVSEKELKLVLSDERVSSGLPISRRFVRNFGSNENSTNVQYVYDICVREYLDMVGHATTFEVRYSLLVTLLVTIISLHIN